MPAYISLVNFTEQGARNAKDTVNQARAFEQALQAAGARKIGIWWTLGQYDLVVVSEAPNDEIISQVILTGILGSVRTNTLRAFSEDEMEKIIQGLP